MSSREIVARLIREDWTETKTGGGSHRQFKKDGRRVTVPHPKKDLPVGTLKSIYKQAGWEWDLR
jgi:predicted RNA binding protein YcfA (HicA-like mRNA interferase family)